MIDEILGKIKRLEVELDNSLGESKHFVSMVLKDGSSLFFERKITHDTDHNMLKDALYVLLIKLISIYFKENQKERPSDWYDKILLPLNVKVMKLL